LEIPGNNQTIKNPLDAVILRSGEEVKQTWTAGTPVASSISVDGVPARTSASLTVLITDLRLIAIRETGILATNYDLYTEMDLEAISGLSLRDVMFQRAVVVNYRAQGGTAELILTGLDDHLEGDRETPNPFKPNSDAPAKRFIASLDTAVRKRIEEVEIEKKRDRIIFDFAALRDLMENGGIVVTTVKCPSCGANVDLPKNGDTFTCAYCGSAIHAVDVMKKLRELISAK